MRANILEGCEGQACRLLSLSFWNDNCIYFIKCESCKHFSFNHDLSAFRHCVSLGEMRLALQRCGTIIDLPQVDLMNFRVEFVFRVEFFRLRSS